MFIPKRDVIEVELEAGHHKLHCWINADPHVHVGVQVTLTDSDNPTMLWTVSTIHGEPRTIPDLSVLEHYQGRPVWGCT